MTSISTSSASLAQPTTLATSATSATAQAAWSPIAEEAQQRPQRPDPSTLFAQFDADGDSMLSTSEFLAMHQSVGERGRGGERGGGPEGAHGHHCHAGPGSAGTDRTGTAPTVDGGGSATPVAAAPVSEELTAQVAALTAQVQVLVERLYAAGIDVTAPDTTYATTSLAAEQAESAANALPTSTSTSGVASAPATAAEGSTAKGDYEYTQGSDGNTYATDPQGDTYLVNADGTGTLVSSTAASTQP